MQTPTYLRPVELARIAHVTKGAVSQATKAEQKRDLLVEKNGKVMGLTPEYAEKYLSRRETASMLYHSAAFVLSTQTGGAGKTSSCISLAAAARRITDRSRAIVMVDSDSQASLTMQTTGKVAPDDVPVLRDWVEGRSSIDELLVRVGDEAENLWVIRSNLQNIYLDRALQRGTQIKTQGLKLFRAIFDHFGRGTKIFVDTPPQLSNFGTSCIAAGAQMPESCYLMIPIRLDLFGRAGAKICLGEARECCETYGLDPSRLRSVCYFSNYDQRTKVSMGALRAVMADESLGAYLAPVSIRYSTEIPRASSERRSVFHSFDVAVSGVGRDYTELLLTTLGWSVPEGND